MDITDNILSFINLTEGFNPNSILKEIAGRVKQSRLELNLTQQTLAKRASVTLPSYRRFETTGEISLKSLVKIAIALDATESFSNLFTKKQYRSLDEVIASREVQKKKRGRKNE